MSKINYDELRAILDSLTDGEHIKATWKMVDVEATVRGPVSVNNDFCSCYRVIRWSDGEVNSTLTSVEVTRDEEVTATREDEKALHALLDSLEDGETVTAEWRDEDGVMILTGAHYASYTAQEVFGYRTDVLRWNDGRLCSTLHSVTTRRSVTQRWEREGDE